METVYLSALCKKNVYFMDIIYIIVSQYATEE